MNHMLAIVTLVWYNGSMRKTENDLQSNCCFAPFNEDHGICTECGEHAEGVFELECGTFSDEL